MHNVYTLQLFQVSYERCNNVRYSYKWPEIIGILHIDDVNLLSLEDDRKI